MDDYEHHHQEAPAGVPPDAHPMHQHPMHDEHSMHSAPGEQHMPHEE